jgi:hypothetical protein
MTLDGILLLLLEFLTSLTKTIFTGTCSSQKGMDEPPFLLVSPDQSFVSTDDVS